jgi:hypothetical protein
MYPWLGHFEVHADAIIRDGGLERRPIHLHYASDVVLDPDPESGGGAFCTPSLELQPTDVASYLIKDRSESCFAPLLR